MKNKFIDYISKYVTVFLGCVVLGAIARIVFMDSGVDDYTGNIIFWVVTAALFIFYLGIIYFLSGIMTIVDNKKAARKNKEIIEFTQADKKTDSQENSNSTEIAKKIQI